MLDIDVKKADFCFSIKAFIKGLQSSSNESTLILTRRRKFGIKLVVVLHALKDYLLFISSINKKKFSELVFIAPQLINYEKFLMSHKMSKPIFINYHGTKLMDKLGRYRVYNLGILLNLKKRITRTENLLKTIELYNIWFNRIFYRLSLQNVYIPCFYDELGFSLIFDNNRERFLIIEIQHGGICNFQPYTTPVEFKISDKIYVDNIRTAKYLKEHLYNKIDVEIIEKNKLSIIKRERAQKSISVIYFSSIEINGLHPVLFNYLKSGRLQNRYKFFVRLHPREKFKELIFKEKLDKLNINYAFDNSNNWIEEYSSENIIVITPWSSVVEEAYENGIPVIIIDEYGKKRYYDIIDNIYCYYSTNLESTINEIINNREWNEEI